jgi:hypothetical protein
MMLGGRATLRPVAAARTLHSRNALLPGLSSLRAATLAPDSPPKWGFMSASRSTVMDQVQDRRRVDVSPWKQWKRCNAGAQLYMRLLHVAQRMSRASYH